MKVYYANKLDGGCRSLNENFDAILEKEKFLIYLGQNVKVDSDFGSVAVLSDDIGRGGGGIIEFGEIYSAVEYMGAIIIKGLAVKAIYELAKDYFTPMLALFKKSKQVGKTLHFNINTEDNSQYHFVFFSYMDEDDFRTAWDLMADFVLKNKAIANTSADCYFDTKSKKWHVVGKRELLHKNIKKYKIY